MKQRGIGLIALVVFGALIVIVGTLIFSLPKQTPELTPSPTPSPTYLPSSKTSPKPESGILSVTDVTNNREAFVGQKIKVRGKLEVRFYVGERPCVTGEPCNTEVRPPTLHVVNPDGYQWVEGNSIDLYKKVFGGKYEQFSCKSTNGETADCGNYKQSTITVVDGVFVKDKIPSMTVGTSTGKTDVLTWQDIYILAVE